jgi:release factor glutamine methyltransferase
LAATDRGVDGLDVAAALRLGARTVGARDGALLLAHALGVERAAVHLWPPATLVPAPAARRYLRLLRERRRGLSVAYITGRAAFWDVDLAVGPAVLVPRPETECLVEAVVDAVRRDGAAAIVDVGTGSGAVAIALKRALPQVAVYATDRSPTALAVARRNVERWAPGVRLLPAGDLLEPLVRAGAQVDVVVMNPPYVRSRDLARLPREVQREPRSALDGGVDGLAVVRRLIGAVGRGQAVVPGARLWLEVGAGQAAAARALLARLGGSTGSVRDLAGIERVVYGAWRA